MQMRDFQDSVKYGLSAENRFLFEAQRRGYEVKNSSSSENYNKHIDFWIRKNKRIASVDVKGRKRGNRKDSKYNDNFIWVEFKNVSGNKGWLLGDQDIIAFERENDFILVNRKELYNIVLSKVNFNQSYVNSSRLAYYKPYQRSGRKDVITKIDASELYNIRHNIWKKVNN